MRTIKSVSMFVVLSMVIAITGVFTGTTWKANASDGSTKWATYTDPRFGFSVEYPVTWIVIQRDDREGTYGGVLTFTPRSVPASVETFPEIVVGLYASERPLDQSLSEWTNLYERSHSLFSPSDIKIEKAVPIRSLAADNQESFVVRGISPLTPFQFTNIPRGRTVWFVWTNTGDDYASVYDHMVSSFRFGASSPKSLKDAYGMIQWGTSQSTPEQESNFAILGSDPAGFRLPFTGQKIITNGPGCGPTHTGASSEAIDYSMVVNTPVKATYGGNVISEGWNNQGFGNLMQVAHAQSRISWYAHLNSFVAYYRAVAKGEVIAYSGNTGNSDGPHLHFEVRVNNQSIWIRTLPTTIWYSGDPNNPCQPAGQNDGYATGP